MIVNIPLIHCYCKSSALTNSTDSPELYESCIVHNVKSLPGRALLFEAYFPRYGANFDKLTIDAFISNPNEINDLLPLHHLQLWDCFSYDIMCIKKSFMEDMKAMCYINGSTFEGVYLFTIDHKDPTGTTLAEYLPEHKSFNIIQLDNGQFAAQPNNRVRFFDLALTDKDAPIPTHWQAPTRHPSVETTTSRFIENENSYFYNVNDKEK